MARSTSDLVNIQWPDGKDFAFTVFDDTDGATIERVGPVYDFLHERGFKTTKSVWPLQHPDTPHWAGSSCEDPEYVAWHRQLQRWGFEVSYHGASWGDNSREDHVRALERFRELFGHAPAAFANHAESIDALYWGDGRVTGLARWAYRLMARFKYFGRFKGHVEGNPHWWGDLCRDQIAYVRNFVYADINTLKACPYMPYADAGRPFVRAWFASSDGGVVDSFCRLLSSANQERLARKHGACIVYSHFAKGFVQDGELRQDFCERMTELAQRNGWFVTTGELLRYIEAQHGGVHALSPRERRRLEWRWLRDKVLLGST